MTAAARVTGGVLVRRAVTAQGDATLLTGPQMYPRCADFDALSTAAALFVLVDGFDGAKVGARLIGGHETVPLLVQNLMHQGDGDRAFTHGGSHPFDASGSHIAHREYTGTAGFQ